MYFVLALFAVFTTALARPDVSHGYTYERGGGGGVSDNFIGAAPFQTNQIADQGLSLFSQSRGSISTGSDLSGLSFGGSFGGYDTTRQQQILTPIVTKNFYIHTAPEETDEQQAVKTVQLGRPQKTYRVVFIKAPSASSRSAQIQAIYPKNEEKTVIYVLTQKADGINIGDIATPAPSVASKPEVFFIKYKTAEEAAQAQQTIKAQYDKLGGTSQVSDEGVAPVQSVIGSVSSSSSSATISNSNFVNTGDIGSVTVSPGVTRGTYLPPSK